MDSEVGNLSCISCTDTLLCCYWRFRRTRLSCCGLDVVPSLSCPAAASEGVSSAGLLFRTCISAVCTCPTMQQKQASPHYICSADSCQRHNQYDFGMVSQLSCSIRIPIFPSLFRSIFTAFSSDSFLCHSQSATQACDSPASTQYCLVTVCWTVRVTGRNGVWSQLAAQIAGFRT